MDTILNTPVQTTDVSIDPSNNNIIDVFDMDAVFDMNTMFDMDAAFDPYDSDDFATTDIVLSSAMLTPDEKMYILEDVNVNVNESMNTITQSSIVAFDIQKDKHNHTTIRIDGHNKPIYDFCCLCGKNIFHHSNVRHKYFAAKEVYKCKKCALFFFEHKHTTKHNACVFTPIKQLS